MLFAQTAHAAGNSIQLSVPSTNITTGSEFNVTVRTDTSTAISGVSVVVSFNPSQLTYLSNSDSGTAFPELWTLTPSTGNIGTTRSTTGASVSGSKVVITFKFKAIAGNGQATLEATAKANANNTPLSLTKGTTVLTFSAPTGGTSGSGSTSGSSSPASGSGATESQTGSAASSGTAEDGSEVSQDQSQMGEIQQKDSGAKEILSAVNPVNAFKEGGSSKSKVGWAFIGAALFLVVASLVYKKFRKRAEMAKHFPDATFPFATPDQTVQLPDSGQVTTPLADQNTKVETEAVVINPSVLQSPQKPISESPSSALPQITHSFTPEKPQLDPRGQVVPPKAVVAAVDPQNPVIVSPNETPKAG